MKRDVAALLHRCDAVVAYKGIRHAVNSEVAAERRAWWRERSGRRRSCRVRHDWRRIEVSVLLADRIFFMQVYGMILSPRVSLPQRMEEGCFFRLFIMTQKRA